MMYTRDECEHAAWTTIDDVLASKWDSYFFSPDTIEYWRKALVIALATKFIAIDKIIDRDDYVDMYDNPIGMKEIIFRPTLQGLWMQFTNNEWQWMLGDKIRILNKDPHIEEAYGSEYLKYIGQQNAC